MCGIAGAYGVEDAAYVVSLMLKTMQHRGQEAAGIVASDGTAFRERKGFGLVDEVFGHTDIAKDLPGRLALGHIRYTTAGDAEARECIQPLVARFRGDDVALAHNGNLTNYAERRREFELEGAIFRSSSDTELFLHCLARGPHAGGIPERLIRSFRLTEGAYSLVLMTRDAMYAAVDPYAFRPLVARKFGNGLLIASETCAFDIFRDDPRLDTTEGFSLSQGTLIDAADPGTPVIHATASVARHCSFEHIYFSRPDSMVFAHSGTEVRQRLGRALARSSGVPTDLVTSVPDSSNAMAVAYAEEAGIPFRFALIRNHYTGRTFITPRQTARELGVRMKLNADRPTVDGKTVTVVDDSLVRGTTARKVVALLREAGAREVHLRIGSPPVISSCHWGIDTPSRKELIAADTPVEDLAAILGADSLAYLTEPQLLDALNDPGAERHCTSCFTGRPPVDEQLIPIRHLTRDRS